MAPDSTTTCSRCGTEYDNQTRDRCPNEVSPSAGGCWICNHEGGDMAFDMEFDTFYHPDCLPDGTRSILEYERRRESEHTIL